MFLIRDIRNWLIAGLALWALGGCGSKSGLSGFELGPCGSDADCDDGQFCNGIEYCRGLLCNRGPRPVCDDGDLCTTNVCDSEEQNPAGGLGVCAFPTIELPDADHDGFFALGTCGDDCNDQNPDIFPGATEVCNAIDDDCDGQIDEGASYLAEGQDHRMTMQPESDGRGDVAFSAESQTWGVTYSSYAGDTSNIYFSELHETGEPVSTPTLITLEPADAFGGPIIWANDSYGLAWQDRRDGVWEIYFNRLTSDGQKLGPDYRVTWTTDWSINPDLLWTGSEYAIAFQDWRHRFEGAPNNFEIYLAFLDADGFKIDNEIRITHNLSSSEAPVIALGDGEIGIAYVDDEVGFQQIYLVVVDLTGNILAAPRRLSINQDVAFAPAIVFLDGSFLVVWQEKVRGSEGPSSDNFDLVASVIPRNSGSIIEGPYPIVTGLAWTRAPAAMVAGDHVLFTYSDDRSGDYQLYGALFDSRLRRISEDQALTSSPADSVFGSMARGSQSVGVLFEDQRDGNWEVYFTRLLCVDPALTR